MKFDVVTFYFNEDLQPFSKIKNEVFIKIILEKSEFLNTENVFKE